MTAAAGVGPRAARKRPGHANVTTTPRACAGPADEDEREAARMAGGPLGLGDGPARERRARGGGQTMREAASAAGVCLIASRLRV